MKTGLFGTHENLVPLQGAQITADNIHVPFAKDVITEAPKIDAEEDFDDSNGVENLYRYYQLDLAAPSGAEGAPATTDTAVAAIRRHQPN